MGILCRSFDPIQEPMSDHLRLVKTSAAGVSRRIKPTGSDKLRTATSVIKDAVFPLSP
jgi:hypothetical protein